MDPEWKGWAIVLLIGIVFVGTLHGARVSTPNSPSRTPASSSTQRAISKPVVKQPVKTPVRVINKTPKNSPITPVAKDEVDTLENRIEKENVSILKYTSEDEKLRRVHLYASTPHTGARVVLRCKENGAYHVARWSVPSYGATIKLSAGEGQCSIIETNITSFTVSYS